MNIYLLNSNSYWNDKVSVCDYNINSGGDGCL
jgi:hypothetical protein